MNYPDLTVYRSLPRGETRQKGPFVMLYPGTLNQHQGVDLAIRAFAAVANRMPDAELQFTARVRLGPRWRR